MVVVRERVVMRVASVWMALGMIPLGVVMVWVVGM